jgi:hypothetical protein
MGAKVYAADLSSERLAEIAAALRPEAPFAILERLTDLEFPASDTLPNVAEWDKGWLFGPALELRWEQQGPAFRAVLTLTDDRDAPDDFGEPGEVLPAGEICEYYLWGEDAPDIGRRLIYEALPSGGRAKLSVEEFRDPQSHALLFYRYVGMQREK